MHVILSHDITIDGDYNRDQIRKSYSRLREERSKKCTKNSDEVINGASRSHVNRLPHFDAATYPRNGTEEGVAIEMVADPFSGPNYVPTGQDEQLSADTTFLPY
jgi:hypothetical protein